MTFLLFLPESRIWHFMQTVSIGDSLHMLSAENFTQSAKFSISLKDYCIKLNIHDHFFEASQFLARLFSKKTTRYCHSSGVVCVVVMQKLGHFVISLSLLKIFTSNSDQLFIMKRGTHTDRGGNPQNIFGTVMSLFGLRIFVEKWFHCDFSRTDGWILIMFGIT